MVRLVRGANYAQLGEDEVILQAAPVSFDASTLEIWGALLNGGRLVLVPGTNPSLEGLGQAIAAHGVTTLWLTAGLFDAMARERLEDLAHEDEHEIGDRDRGEQPEREGDHPRLADVYEYRNKLRAIYDRSGHNAEAMLDSVGLGPIDWMGDPAWAMPAKTVARTVDRTRPAASDTRALARRKAGDAGEILRLFRFPRASPVIAGSRGESGETAPCAGRRGAVSCRNSHLPYVVSHRAHPVMLRIPLRSRAARLPLAAVLVSRNARDRLQ